jgi:hypothetical protein
MAQRGATIAELASACSVYSSTFHVWLSEYPALREAVDVGNEAFDTRIERALAERALGYSVDVEEWFIVRGKLESKQFRRPLARLLRPRL